MEEGIEAGTDGWREGGMEGGNEKWWGRGRHRSMTRELIEPWVQFWRLKAEGRTCMYTYLGCVYGIDGCGYRRLLVLLPGLP